MSYSQGKIVRSSSACHTMPQLHRWETSTRYYLALVQQDLFGSWELLRMWGGKGSSRGGALCEPAADELHALSLLDDTARRRERRGYRKTENS
jgi:hypothetical protein